MKQRWLGNLCLLAILPLAIVACGDENPPKGGDTAAEEDAEDDGGGDIAGADGTGADGADTAGGHDGTDDTAGTDHDVADAGDDTGGPDAIEDAPVGTDDAATEDAGTDGGTKPDLPPAKKLPLPDCAGAETLSDNSRCANCASKCGDFPICGPDKKTYKNDCEAICALKAYDGLKPEEWVPKACPACSFCDPLEKVPTSPTDWWCVTLDTGLKITVKQQCEAKCVKFKPKPDGTPTMTKGECKNACSQPPPAGGGCSQLKYQPVCAKEDGKTYFSECAMQNCDLNGCYAVGSTTKTATCAPDAMTKECDGECFDATKTPNCGQDCDAVCGILKDGKGQSFRNACVATTQGATVGSCDGISATANDVCSASLYKAKGCCPDVDYANVKQVCASKGDQWVTFRNQGEFECLTAGDKEWLFQYQGPCICKCTADEKPVCGDDKLTYTNACQAECYNPGGQFNWTPGACQ